MKKILLKSFLALIILQYGCDQKSNEIERIAQFEQMSNKELNEIPKKDRPDLAALYDYTRTKDLSLGYPPRERLFEAKDYIEKLFNAKNASRVIENVSWTERGPNNFGGRTRAIMFDPNDPLKKKVWSGGVAGGLWTNDDITDPNVSWKVVNDFLPNLAIGSMNYDPTNTNIFYFGTGEGWNGGGMVRGAGIWKSVDGGESWDRLSSTEERFSYVQKIEVTQQGTVLAAVTGTGVSGIQRSTDGGVTWETVINAGRGADIEIAGNNIYASTIDGDLFKSTDDGVTWVDILPTAGDVGRIEIGVSKNSPNTVYVVANSGLNAIWLYRSNNAGDSWTSSTLPNYYNTNCTVSDQVFTRDQGWFDLILGVYPDNPNVLFIGGIDLFRSDDGGLTWSLVSYWTGACDDYVHADQHNLIFRPGAPKEMLSTNDGGVFYVNDITVPIADGGPVFKARNKDYNVTQYYAVAIANEVSSNVMLAGAQDNGSHQFRDHGINSTIEVTGGDGAFVFIDQEDPNLQITSYVFNNYYVSLDGFEDFVSFGVGDNSGSFINPSEYDTRTKTLYAAGNNDEINVYSNLDTGIPITNVRSLDLGGGRISSIGLSNENSTTVFVGAAGSVYKIENVGTDNPTSTQLGNVPGNVSSVAIGANDDQILITVSNYGLISVYETRDGGVNWTNKEGNLPDMPVWWGLYNPNNTNQVIVATELGVWSIDDISSDNVTWGPANEGLANVSSRHLRYRTSDGLVAVATHGRGVYTSDVFAPAAVADFYSNIQIGFVGKPISFFDASLKADSYSWNFGDGTTSTESDPVHEFLTTGTFDITLELNGDNTKSITKKISVLPSLDVDFTLANGGDFETNQDYFFPVTLSGTGFELGSSTVPGKSGTNSGDNAWVTGLSEFTYASFSESYLYSPEFDFAISGPYELEFFTKYELEDDWEGFIVEYSIDGALSWTRLGELDVDNWYNQLTIGTAIAFEPNSPMFSGNTSNEFVKKSIDLTFLSSQESVVFRFVFKTDPESEFAGLAIDDFKITGPVETTPSVAFQASGETACIGEEITFTNSSTGSITTYSWDFGDGAIPASATGYGPHEVQYTTGGDKSVVLTAATSGDDIVETLSISVGEPPLDVVATSDATEICFGDSGIVLIGSSQAGINYTLRNLTDGVNVGDAVAGTGGEITLTTGPVSAAKLYRIIAETATGCSILLSESFDFVGKNKPEVSVQTQSNGSLKASFNGASEYFWYLDGALIEGESGQSIQPTVSGSYQVAVANGACIGLSEAFDLLILGINDLGINYYPNPVRDLLTIEGVSELTFVEILDLSGSLIKRYEIKRSTQLDLSDLASGMFFLRVTSNKGTSIERFVKD